MIPYGRQSITEEDISSVVRVLRSDHLTQGPAVPLFESALCQYTTAKAAVAVSSATSALHLACRALHLSPGDWLWTSPITFVASANSALYCGAFVDFVDIDPCSYNMSVPALAERLAVAEQEGRLPKIVMPVHMCGQAADMREISELSKRYGFRVIEDASHAIGGAYAGRPVGSCAYSDITVFSFHPVKIVTTGEGGAALTNDHSLAERMALLRSHGITREPAEMRDATDGPWYYQQIDLGYNYRMTDLQAALGLSQLDRLDEFVRRRNELARRYDRMLAGLPLRIPAVRDGRLSAFHLYVVRLKLEHIGNTRRQVFEDLRAAGIGVNVHYIPLHTQPYFRDCGFVGNYPEAERYYAEALTLPLYPDMSEAQQDTVVTELVRILESA